MLEIACFNEESAIIAAAAGADRIELCADYAVGGVTPELSTLHRIRASIGPFPINVMIRPRAGDFVYSDSEFKKMKSDIQTFKPVVDGFVFGILDQDNAVDVVRNRELVEMASPRQCTFHRAFDGVSDLAEAMELIVQCGFTSILTSGGEANAVLGAGVVKELQQQFRGRIVFILGGGVRSGNVGKLKGESCVEWFHSAAITADGESADEEEIRRIQAVLE